MCVLYCVCTYLHNVCVHRSTAEAMSRLYEMDKLVSKICLIEVKVLEGSSGTRLEEKNNERERETPAFMPSSTCSRLSHVSGCTAIHNITTRGHRERLVMVHLDCGGALYFKASLEKDGCNIFLAFSSLIERLCAYCLF